MGVWGTLCASSSLLSVAGAKGLGLLRVVFWEDVALPHLEVTVGSPRAGGPFTKHQEHPTNPEGIPTMKPLALWVSGHLTDTREE